nr:sigma-54 dependent transcriptional regulator [Campylobacter anatolicus]
MLLSAYLNKGVSVNIAIVEDDINMRKSLELALSEYEELNIKTYKSATEALKKLDESVELIITDINMPGIDGLEFIKQLGGKYDVIIMTGNATLNRAIESVRLGVKDFLTKPFDATTLYEAIKRVKTLNERTKTHKITTKKADKNLFDIIDDELSQNSDLNLKNSFKTQSSKNLKTSTKKSIKNQAKPTSVALQKTQTIALKAAKTDANVMLMGESGVGKEVFANFIHQNSPRKNEPFIALNMAAIPENLIESELFGFEKGAFTDATVAKKGQFELANGGTLFLDEIAEMPINLQPKLLRALQEREITRLGAMKSIKIDVRIVCATNANLDELMAQGKFREDLFYRLNTIPIVIPPLRERKEEIMAIANNTLKQTCDEYKIGAKFFSDEAVIELMSYSYPGNIRELISIVQRAAILSDTDEIGVMDLFINSRKMR